MKAKAVSESTSIKISDSLKFHMGKLKMQRLAKKSNQTDLSVTFGNNKTVVEKTVVDDLFSSLEFSVKVSDDVPQVKDDFLQNTVTAKSCNVFNSNVLDDIFSNTITHKHTEERKNSTANLYASAEFENKVFDKTMSQFSSLAVKMTIMVVF